MALTDSDIAAAPVRDKPYKIGVGGSLYVLVERNGSKLWRWKYRIRGREKLMAVGRHPDVDLMQARMRAAAARLKVKAGVDPMDAQPGMRGKPIVTVDDLPLLPAPMNGSRVYFVQIASGHVKIGVSTNVHHRVAAFQNAHAEPVILLGSMPGGHQHEQVLHQAFARDRDEGEWFSPSPDLLEFIAGIEPSPCL